MNNPFTLMFGKEPLQFISRYSQVNQVVEAFDAENSPYQICMITGVRGSGKTVTLTNITKKLLESENWLAIELNPARDLLQGLAAKLTSNMEFCEMFRQAKINLSFLGFGVEISGVPPITDIEVAITKMLENLRKHNKRILVTIDEVTVNDYIRVFAGSFQIFARQELPIYLLMTGLHENIDDLQNEKNLTFLYRAPKLKLGPLNTGAVASKYKSIFEIEEEEAFEMAKLTKGYPFAFQVLGYLCWQEKATYNEILPIFDQYLSEYVYDKIWSTLSKKDREILNGIAQVPDGKIKEIRDVLGIDNNQFNPYRKRLINKGLINGDMYGYVQFQLPRFDKYVKENS